MRYGLCGAHRVGKTTLMNEVAAKLDIPVIQTSTSAIFTRRNLDPATHYDFSTRMSVQQDILSHLVAGYATETQFITDRTPLDLLAYTIADVNNSTSADCQTFIQDYYEKSIAVLKQFDKLFLVQPAIPIVLEPGKASTLPIYLDHLNYLMLGILSTGVVPYAVIPKDVTRLEDRVSFILNNLNVRDAC